MRYCEFCRQENDDDSLFCIKCGQQLGAQSGAAQPSFTSPVAQVDPFGAQNAFESVSSSAAPDAFARDLPAASDPFAQNAAPTVDSMAQSIPDHDPFAQGHPAVSTPIFPQDTIDIFELKAREGAQGDPASEENGDSAFSSGPAHAAGSYEDDASELLTAMEDLDERLSTIESLIKKRAASTEELIGKLSEQFEGKISRNEHEATVLKNMSDEMQEYRDGLYAKLTLPLIRDLIDAREALGMALLHRGAEAAEGSSKLAADVELCRDMLADSLTRNAVEIVKTKPGDEFTSFKHKIVGKVHTSDSSQHGRIAEVQGDSYKMGEQYVSPAMVKVYTIEEAGE